MLLQNKKIFFDFEIKETFTAGISLLGWEVKSLRARRANFRSSWAKISGGEIFLQNFKINPWPFSQQICDELRPRKLLLKKREIRRIDAKIKERFIAVPTKIFEKNGKIKCEIALGRGRKKFEKRQILRERATEKKMRQIIKNFNS